jgi:SAM-dependent methyltransferase
MSISEQIGQQDFKARLYERYLTEHVGLAAHSVQKMIDQRLSYLRHSVLPWLPAEKSARILDLGCGYGGIMCAAREAGYRNLTGVDVSPEQIEAARELGLEDVHCEDVNAFLSKVPDGTYNAVIAFDILEHFTRPELLDLTDELRRILARGGRLIVHVPNAEGIFSGTIRYGDLTHELAFTRGSMGQLAQACRFRLLAVREDVPVVHGAKSLVRNLIWRFGSMFFRMLATAETGSGFRDKPLTQNLLAIMEAD